MTKLSSSPSASKAAARHGEPVSRRALVSLAPINRDAVESLHASVYATVRQAIIDGVLEAGQRYFENDVAAQLEVSRTPVREALRSLAAQGIVLFEERKKGFVVVDPIEDVVIVHELRQRLEGLAAKFAAQRITVPELDTLDGILSEMHATIEGQETESRLERIAHLNDEFHQAINTASGSGRLTALIDQLEPIYISRRIVVLYSMEELRRSHDSHREILRALWARDGDLAEKLTRQHLRQGQQFAFSRTNEVHGGMVPGGGDADSEDAATRAGAPPRSQGPPRGDP